MKKVILSALMCCAFLVSGSLMAQDNKDAKPKTEKSCCQKDKAAGEKKTCCKKDKATGEKKSCCKKDKATTETKK